MATYTYTYDATQLATSLLFQVRRLINDVGDPSTGIDESNARHADEELAYLLDANDSDIYSAGADALEAELVEKGLEGNILSLGTFKDNEMVVFQNTMLLVKRLRMLAGNFATDSPDEIFSLPSDDGDTPGTTDNW